MNEPDPITYLPERKNKFVCREHLLEIIDDLFKENQLISICGFAGIGKSTLALEYGHRSTHKLNVRWMNADLAQKFELDFRDLASSLQIQTSNINIKEIKTQVYTKLKNLDSGLLFILDNLQNYDDISKNYLSDLPQNSKCLLTTRDQLRNHKLAKIELEPFSLVEAKDYVSKNLETKPTDDEINKIISFSSTQNQNGGEILPIKIEIIAAYINSYKNQDNTIDELLNKIAINEYHHNKVEYSLFLQIQIDFPIAYLILQYCSYLDPSFVSKSLIDHLLRCRKGRLIINNELNLDKLLKLSLLAKTSKDKKIGFRIHRLVQEEIRVCTQRNENDDAFYKNESLLCDIIECLNKLFDNVDENPTSWKANEEYYLQSLTIFKRESDLPRQNRDVFEKFIHITNKLASYEENAIFNLWKSMEFNLKVSEMCQSLYNPAIKHPLMAASLNLIGVKHLKLDNYTLALEYIQKAHEIRSSSHKTDHAHVAESLNNIGACYFSLFYFDKSLENFLSSYEMRLRVFGRDKDHKDIAQSLDNIGLVYSRLNKLNESLEFSMKAYEMRQRLFGSDHAQNLQSLINVSKVYASLSEFQRALEFSFKAYETAMRLYNGNDNRFVADACVNIGSIYKKENDFKRALEFYVKAYEMRVRLYKNQDHLDIANALEFISLTYYELKEVDGYEENSRKAAEMKIRLFPNDLDSVKVGITYTSKIMKWKDRTEKP
jgi:hypothetical protein